MKLFTIIKNTFFYVFAAICIVLLVSIAFQRMTGKDPGVFGYHLMYVMTGSMEPEIMAGDAVIVRETDGKNVRRGDVVCYLSETGETKGVTITHKVVEEPYEQGGQMFLRTKGTANPLPDDPIRTDQVYGKVICRISLIGRLYSFFCTVPGLVAVLLPIAGIMIGEMIRLVRSFGEDEDAGGDESGKGIGETEDSIGNHQQ